MKTKRDNLEREKIDKKVTIVFICYLLKGLVW